MGITWNEKERVFHLRTPRTSYLIGIVDAEGFIAHLYYGPRVPDDDLKQLIWLGFERPEAYAETGNQLRYLSSLPMEYSTGGTGDFREPCLSVETADGGRACGLVYAGHSISRESRSLRAFPPVTGTMRNVRPSN